jgi:hypothetical protein
LQSPRSSFASEDPRFAREDPTEASPSSAKASPGVTFANAGSRDDLPRDVFDPPSETEISRCETEDLRALFEDSGSRTEDCAKQTLDRRGRSEDPRAPLEDPADALGHALAPRSDLPTSRVPAHLLRFVVVALRATCRKQAAVRASAVEPVGTWRARSARRPLERKTREEEWEKPWPQRARPQATYSA